jgi:hypothetical protein
VERRWPPGTVAETHSHPFALRALAVQRETWLTVGVDVRHLCAGDSLALERDVLHTERHGPRLEGRGRVIARSRRFEMNLAATIVDRKRPGLAALCLLALATGANAQDKCSGTGVLAGEKFSVTHCAAAIYPDDHSVTLWFNERPITPQELGAFRMSAYPGTVKDGKERTMLLLAFCPGGGKEAAAAGSIRKIDFGTSHANSPLGGAQWVIEAPKDFKVERIAGDVKPGGRLAGRITGGRSVDGRAFAWDLVFDVQLPTQEAASGVACGT